MDKLVYVVSQGAREAMAAQALHAHNIANATTPAFKADLQTIKSQQLLGSEFPTRVYASADNSGYNLSSGSMQTTDNPLDITINDAKGMLAVQTVNDNKEKYTRRGDLNIDANGVLVNGAGNIVLGDGGPIVVPPAKKIEISRNGVISILPVGGGDKYEQIGRIKLVTIDDANMVKAQDGLFVTKDNTVLPLDAGISVTSGGLESSNVNVVSELIEFMELARSFEITLKMASLAEQNDQASARIMQVG